MIRNDEISNVCEGRTIDSRGKSEEDEITWGVCVRVRGGEKE